MYNKILTLILSGIFLLTISLCFNYLYPNKHTCNNIAICNVKISEPKEAKEASIGLSKLFDTSGFTPRWTCGEWSAFQGWTSIFSDLLIFLSYFGIPAGLLFFLNKTRPKDLTFKNLLTLFIAFIVSCGLTHLIEVILFWKPVYNLSILVKFITAVVSFTTFIALVRTTPKLLQYKSPAELQIVIDEQTQELTDKNNALNEEIEERRMIEIDLKESLALNNELYRENQHRIKNNLQMISSLLYIRAADQDEKQQAEFEEIGKRVNSISRIHELLLKDGLTTAINVQEYFQNLGDQLVNIHHTQIELNIDVDSNLELCSDDVINCGLIFSEFFSNSVKHAFDGISRPKINLSFQTKGTLTSMLLIDNGKGFDTSKTSEGSFGIGLMENFADNMRGTLNIMSSPKGTTLTLDWKNE